MIASDCGTMETAKQGIGGRGPIVAMLTVGRKLEHVLALLNGTIGGGWITLDWRSVLPSCGITTNRKRPARMATMIAAPATRLMASLKFATI